MCVCALCVGLTHTAKSNLAMAVLGCPQAALQQGARPAGLWVSSPKLSLSVQLILSVCSLHRHHNATYGQLS